MIKLIERPCIFNFLNATTFLNALFKYHKLKNKKFSYELWGAQLGYRSPGYIEAVLSNQREVSEDLIRRVASTEHLNGMELEYFKMAAASARTSEASAKEFYFRRMVQIGSLYKPFIHIESGDQNRFSGLIPQIFYLLGLSDFQCQLSQIVKTVAASDQEVLEVLELLEKKGMIQKSESDSWYLMDTSYLMLCSDVMPTEDLSRSIRNFQDLLSQLKTEDLEAILKELELSLGTLVGKYRVS